MSQVIGHHPPRTLHVHGGLGVLPQPGCHKSHHPDLQQHRRFDDFCMEHVEVGKVQRADGDGEQRRLGCIDGAESQLREV